MPQGEKSKIHSKPKGEPIPYLNFHKSLMFMRLGGKLVLYLLFLLYDADGRLEIATPELSIGYYRSRL